MLSWLVLSLLSLSVESYVLLPLYRPLSYIYPPGPLLHTPYIQISPPVPQPELEFSTLEKGSIQLITFLLLKLFYSQGKNSVQPGKIRRMSRISRISTIVLKSRAELPGETWTFATFSAAISSPATSPATLTGETEPMRV